MKPTDASVFQPENTLAFEVTRNALPFFFFNDTATTEIYTTVHTLSLHDALPISSPAEPREGLAPGEFAVAGSAQQGDAAGHRRDDARAEEVLAHAPTLPNVAPPRARLTIGAEGPRRPSGLLVPAPPRLAHPP